MALPSPVAQLPDVQPIMQQAQARARDLTQSAWASLSQPTLFEQEQAKAAAQAQQQQMIDARQMALWGTNPIAAASAEGTGSPQRQAMFTGEAYTGEGFAPNVPRSLIGTESGGNWNAQNNVEGAGGAKGHFGILQFGQARLDDAKRAGIIPQTMTPEQFKASQGAQVAVSNWHFGDIDQRIRKAGLDRYVGQTIGGVALSPNGMRAMAHLGGFGGLQKFIQTNGAYDPADDFGTTLSAYGRTHGY